MTGPANSADTEQPGRVPRPVRLLGLTSFFNHLSSDMIATLLPVFLATTLGAGGAVIGPDGGRPGPGRRAALS